MQESQERVVAVRASAVCVAGTHPSVRVEDLGVRAPERGGGVDGIWAEDDVCALRDELVEDSGVVESFATGDRDGGIQAERLVADSVEKRKFFEKLCGDGDRGVVGGWEVSADFLTKASLDGKVLTEGCHGPGSCGCGCLVAGGEKGHKLVDEVFCGEVARGEGH